MFVFCRSSNSSRAQGAERCGSASFSLRLSLSSPPFNLYSIGGGGGGGGCGGGPRRGESSSGYNHSIPLFMRESWMWIEESMSSNCHHRVSCFIFFCRCARWSKEERIFFCFGIFFSLLHQQFWWKDKLSCYDNVLKSQLWLNSRPALWQLQTHC